MRFRFAGLFLIVPVGLLAQSYGEISGAVLDASGAGITVARVAVRHLATGREYRAAASDSGVHRVPFLPPGAYPVEASAAGFQTARASHVAVQVDCPVRVDFTLKAGAQVETIDVVETLPLIKGENANAGTVSENRRIVELPLNGRNRLQMVALAPHVSAEMRASSHVDSRQGGERGRRPMCAIRPLSGACSRPATCARCRWR